jgi:hypothetical protein
LTWYQKIHLLGVSQTSQRIRKIGVSVRKIRVTDMVAPSLVDKERQSHPDLNLFNYGAVAPHTLERATVAPHTLAEGEQGLDFLKGRSDHL